MLKIKAGFCQPFLFMPNNTFHKSERLCSKLLMDELFSKGKTIKTGAFKVVCLLTSSLTNTPAQLLISVPKKKFKHAVTRNLIKRRIREAYRQHKHSLYQALNKSDKGLLIAIIYTGNHIPSYNEVSDKIILSLQRLQHKHEVDSKENSNIPN